MLAVLKDAVISEDGKYRYRLFRDLETGARDTACFIMVNPSTADAANDDPTIRKLIGFSQRYGFGRFIVVNKFAYRATDAIGAGNDIWIEKAVSHADHVIVAWGPVSKLPKGRMRERWKTVLKIIQAAGKAPMCLGDVAGDGHPRHPLMPSYDAKPTPWDGRYAASM